MVGRRMVARLDKAALPLLLLALIGALTLAGCGAAAPAPRYATALPGNRTYTVQPGDTIYHIASRFGVSVSDLMAANGISDANGLRVGQTLVIPGSYHATAPAYAGRSNAFPYHGERAARQFAWPVSDGIVSSGFGVRNGAMHEGIDIAAPAGTPVRAADGGVVIFAGQLHGYGNVVIVGHNADYATVYGHNEVNLVNEGTHVTCGQMLARIGSSGRTTGANLHFEVRHDNVARNPLAYLPEPPAAPGITYAESGT